jgi:F0F1-type ATP synthase assembly protein I
MGVKAHDRRACFLVSWGRPVMSESRDGHESHEDALRLADLALEREARRLFPKWRLRFGPIVLQSRIDPENFARVYILFNISCLLAGIALIFLKGAFQVLGISLIVGGLFSFGAFVAQLWAVAAHRGHEVLDRAIGHLYDDEKYAELRRLALIRHELKERYSNEGDPTVQSNRKNPPPRRPQ